MKNSEFIKSAQEFNKLASGSIDWKDGALGWAGLAGAGAASVAAGGADAWKLRAGHTFDRFTNMSGLGKISGPLGGLGSLGTLFSKNEDTGRNWAIAGTAPGLVGLNTQVGVAKDTFKSLRAAGKSRLGASRALLGLPVAALAATPLLLHAVKKQLGGYDNN